MNDSTNIRYFIDLLEGKKNIINLNPLPYATDGLAPVMSEKTIELHYNTLTKNYVKNANKAGDQFQIAGAFLHNLWWEQFYSPKSNNLPKTKVLELINDTFGSFSNFKDEFEEKATTIQGNGWCVLTKTGSIIQIPNHKKINGIVLLLDMWEHAYIFDYMADKSKYVKNFWKIINWDTINLRL